MRSEISLLAVASVMAGLTSCGASDSGSADDDSDGMADGSCAYTVRYGGTDYLGTDRYIGTSGPGLIVASELGSAKQVECTEGGQNFPGSDAAAYRIKGIDPHWAVAYGDSDDRAMIVVANVDLPDGVKDKLQDSR
jgi:hypothetical protein